MTVRKRIDQIYQNKSVSKHTWNDKRG